MKRYLSAACITLAALLHACCGKSAVGGEIIRVDAPHEEHAISFDNARAVTLEQDSVVIGYIKRVEIVAGQNAILVHTGNSLLLYDYSGRFVCRIGQPGRAANEYAAINSFWTDGDNIRLLDSNGPKIMSYTFDGQLQNVAKMPDSENSRPFVNVIPLGRGYIGTCVWRGVPDCPALAYYDENLAFCNTLGELTISDGMTLGFPLSRSAADDDILYCFPLDRTIYRLSEETVRTAYTIDFGAKNFPEMDDRYDLLELVTDNDWMASHAGFIAYIRETEDNLLFTYLDNGDMNIGVYNRKEQSLKTHRLPSDKGRFMAYGSDGLSLFVFVMDEEGELRYYTLAMSDIS